jgi:peptidyl-prolyl cis-trans isomerase A (cyclophilin A)
MAIMSMRPQVRLFTDFGAFVVALDAERAPVTANNFLAYVDNGLLDGATVYRIVTDANQPPGVAARIEVVQFGLQSSEARYPTPLPAIEHEPTGRTGLSHRDGTISMARFAVGSASSGFFICIGDQPELDEGGRRNPDGHGFAAFGEVVEGMDVVRAIFGRAEANERLSHPIPIHRAIRAA